MIKNSYPPSNLNRQKLGSVVSALVLACLIFLGLTLTQLRSDPPPDTPKGALLDIVISPPDSVPPEPPDPPEEEEEEEKPELEEEVPPLTIDQIEAKMNPLPGGALNPGRGIEGFGDSPDSIREMDTFVIEDLDKSPRRLLATRPIYPIILKQAGVEGSVRLIIIVDENGNVIEARAQRASHREFARAAIDAVLQWKFEPGTRKKKPVKVKRIQPFSFNIADR